jgi:general secretion pathway protein D
MKPFTTLLLAAVLLVAASANTTAQQATQPGSASSDKNPPAAPPTSEAAAPNTPPATDATSSATPSATPQSSPHTGTPAAETPSPPLPEGMLRLNFRGVPIEMVLDYLSDAAGFIIVKETEVRGKVDVWSNQPVTKEEAIALLNTILNKNDYAAVRNGRTLTIVARDEAKKRTIPVKRAVDAEDIPRTDQMVTQILPVQAANVTQLLNNLQPLIGSYATMAINESANALIVTATEADIHRLAEIINALDESISSTSSLKVFQLRYADAKELATVIRDLFAPTTTQQQGQGGGRGGQLANFLAGGGFGGAAAAAAAGRGGGGGAAAGRGGAVNARVVAVADERSNSLVVAAPEGMIETITDVVERIDQPVNDVTELRVFRLLNSDPLEMADMLASLFPDETRSNTGGNNQQFQFAGGGFGGRGGGRGGNTAANQQSQRMKKMGRVLAVPDPRTSSLVVSAASELMPQISQMIAQLDASPARKQKVFVYSLENADVQEVQQILQDMFQRSTTTANRNNANQSSALSTRIQSNNQAISSGVGNNNGFGGTGLGNQGLGGGQQFR